MRVMGRPVGILDRGAGVAPWEMVLDDYDFSVGGAWGNAAEFSITEVPGELPNGSGWEHENLGNLSNRARILDFGTFGTAREMLSFWWSGVSAIGLSIGIRDQTVGMFVVGVDFNSITGTLTSIGSEIGTDISYKAKEVLEGVWLLSIKATPTNPGNSRRLYIYPTGRTLNNNIATIYRGCLQIRSHWV